MQHQITGFILDAEEVPMDDKETGTEVNMVKLTIYDAIDKTTRADWVSPEHAKGFTAKLVSKIVGQKILATYRDTNYDGVKKTKLDTITPV